MAQQHPRSRASVRRAVSSDAAFLGSLPRARQQNGLPILASVCVDILGLINAQTLRQLSRALLITRRARETRIDSTATPKLLRDCRPGAKEGAA